MSKEELPKKSPTNCATDPFNGTNLIGPTNTTLTLTNVQSWQLGNYSVLITNTLGSVMSSNGLLTVNAAPMITMQPVSQTNFVGGAASFAVTAIGSTPLSFQWNFNQTNLFAATTNAALTLTNLQF
jgi:hypothetical protein